MPNSPDADLTPTSTPTTPTEPASPLFSKGKTSSRAQSRTSQETPTPPLSETPPPSDDPGAYDQPNLEAGSLSEARSTGKKRGAKLRELRKVARAAVETVGGIAHQVLNARSPEGYAAGVWLPDDDDVDGISEPLASLASRRAPEAIDNPDATDLVALGMALVGYVMKSLARRAQVAQEYPTETGAGADQDDPGETAGDTTSAEGGPTFAPAQRFGQGAARVAGGFPDVDQAGAGASTGAQ